MDEAAKNPTIKATTTDTVSTSTPLVHNPITPPSIDNLYLDPDSMKAYLDQYASAHGISITTYDTRVTSIYYKSNRYEEAFGALQALPHSIQTTLLTRLLRDIELANLVNQASEANNHQSLSTSTQTTSEKTKKNIQSRQSATINTENSTPAPNECLAPPIPTETEFEGQPLPDLNHPVPSPTHPKGEKPGTEHIDSKSAEQITKEIDQKVDDNTEEIDQTLEDKISKTLRDLEEIDETEKNKTHLQEDSPRKNTSPLHFSTTQDHLSSDKDNLPPLDLETNPLPNIELDVDVCAEQAQVKHQPSPEPETDPLIVKKKRKAPPVATKKQKRKKVQPN
ncbi:uncharacterized protein MELLADRAFT_65244 [Melampsora larici-populina 98AG31]|uniref:Uncharacterized protein n=1 Tax=Melampsora larici-populina (strain 98AG31 / pathotype 3-4-7) TaxID=747676 RepID=F4RUK3_MELLP|nr:uncharacterized protein MELLADRAFT_65244 [Melampsora larici-populina 98AG31]EGG03980.1 hypothetical protein MELLADRAFT_65244 [Melampsora larici-populina 98AG31]